MSDYLGLIIWTAVIGTVFAIMWKTGQLVRLSNYVAETREELKKCTWPSVDELKGSTVLVLVTIVGLGLFTVSVDFVLVKVVQFILDL